MSLSSSLRLVAVAALLAGPALAFAQAQPGGVMTGRAPALSHRELGTIRAEFARARDRLRAIERDLERAKRQDLPAVREAALTEWQRVLDELTPPTARLSADVPDERALRDEYDRSVMAYREAIGGAAAGQMMIAMGQQWGELSAGTEGWEQESTPATFATITADKPAAATTPSTAPTTAMLGLPKTAAFARAASRYLSAVGARDDYGRFKYFPNIANDVAQVRAARERAYEKLAVAADAVLDDAGAARLDQSSRNRFERFVEEDLSGALLGSPAGPALQSRGRDVIAAYDVERLGAERANKDAAARLTRSADAAWPMILERYAATPLVQPRAGAAAQGNASPGATPGRVVLINGVRNQIGNEFAAGEYDFAAYIDGVPVVAVFAPAVKQHMADVMKLTGMDALPADQAYDLVAVVRGTARVPAAGAQRSSTTNPATTAPAENPTITPTTTPANPTTPTTAAARVPTDVAVVDVIAVRAGAACVGIDAPMR